MKRPRPSAVVVLEQELVREEQAFQTKLAALRLRYGVQMGALPVPDDEARAR